MAYVNTSKFPSVTRILRPYIDSEWFNDESRDRGSAVHESCSAYLQGTFIPPLHPDHQPYFDSARRWIDMAVDKVILVETRLEDPALRYCGKPDLIAVLKGEDMPSLIDFKTSQAAQPWWKLQLAAYRKLAGLFNTGGPCIQTIKGLSVRIKSDGTGCLSTEYRPGSMIADFNIFLSALNCYHFFNTKEVNHD